MILVDSSVWIDYFTGAATSQTDFLDRILGEEPILVGDLVLAEVLQGFRHDDDFDAARRALLSRFRLSRCLISIWRFKVRATIEFYASNVSQFVKR